MPNVLLLNQKPEFLALTVLVLAVSYLLVRFIVSKRRTVDRERFPELLKLDVPHAAQQWMNHQLKGSIAGQYFQLVIAGCFGVMLVLRWLTQSQFWTTIVLFLTALTYVIVSLTYLKKLFPMMIYETEKQLDIGRYVSDHRVALVENSLKHQEVQDYLSSWPAFLQKRFIKFAKSDFNRVTLLTTRKF